MNRDEICPRCGNWLTRTEERGQWIETCCCGYYRIYPVDPIANMSVAGRFRPKDGIQGRSQDNGTQQDSGLRGAVPE